MKILRWLGIGVGIALVAVIGYEVGWTSIIHTLGILKWKYAIVLTYPITWAVLNTAGWWWALHPQSVTIRFRELIEIRLAGETFNSVLPSGYLGGEPVKAKLLSRWTSLREATSSVLVAKSAQSIALLGYLGLGLVVGLPSSTATSVKIKFWLALGALTLGIGIFTLLLANQSFSRLGRFVHGLTKWPWLAAQEPRLVALDDSLGSFYRQCKDRFGLSVFWYSLGWFAGMMELMLIFTLIGHPISWRQAWFMGALAQLGSVIGLISPAGVGFYEGGHYMAAIMLGLPPALGVSVSLIRRVREVFWNGLGLICFSRYSKETKLTPEPVLAGPGK